MKKFLLSALCATAYLLLGGCMAETAKDDFETVEFDISEFPLSDVSYEEVSLPGDFIHAHTFYVYSDSLFILMNNPTAEFFLEVYNLHSGERIGAYIRKGNGPGEALNCNMELYGEKLIVRDFVKKNFCCVNLDQLLDLGSDYRLDEFRSYLSKDGSFPVTLCPLGEDSLLIMNSYCFDSDELRVKNSEPRFYYNERTFRKGLVNTFNISQGKMQINTDANRIVFVHNSRPEMEIYDLDLKKLRMIYGPTRMHVSYNKKHLCFSKNVPEAYKGLTSNGKYVYATYVGNQRDNSIEASLPYTHILQYDWDGNLLKAARLPLRLDRISATSEPGVFYVGSGLSRNEERILYKVKCEGWLN